MVVARFRNGGLSMKKIITLIIVAVMAFSIQLNAASTQTNAEETIMVRKSDLPPQVLKDLEERQALATLSERIQTYGKWVGIGKEVGAAVNDSLSAVTAQADNFSKTGVGKFTMFLVAYKVLGRELIGVVVGIPLEIIWIFLLIYSWRRLFKTTSVLERVEDKKKFYKMVPPAIEKFDDNESRIAVPIVLIIVFIIATVWTVAGLIV
jgi:hypothetical protein